MKYRMLALSVELIFRLGTRRVNILLTDLSVRISAITRPGPTSVSARRGSCSTRTGDPATVT